MVLAKLHEATDGDEDFHPIAYVPFYKAISAVEELFSCIEIDSKFKSVAIFHVLNGFISEANI